ncbi:MAG: endonuclease [Rhodanobacteraceae bacterium]
MQRFSRFAGMIAALLWVVPALADTRVFINELHYDNGGSDTGEAIEVAGPAGTDLAGWSLVLYNGSTGTSYGSISLNGTLASTCGSYGVASFPAPGLQNGAPDGVALVDSSGIVRQFISYEGQFTASGGAAAGAASVDIGVSESGSTASSQSLQLSGSGAFASDFTWQAPASNTFGGCNAGQSFSGGSSGGGSNALQNGIAVTGIAASQGTFSSTYTVTIPAGASNLVIGESGGSGDADMYVQFGSAPDQSNFDCRPYLYGNEETCSFSAPQAGVYYVRLYGWQAFAGVTLEAAWDEPAGGGSGGGSGYYSGVDTSSPTALRSSLHQLLEQVTKIPYTDSATDTWDVLSQADEDPANGGDVIEVYTNRSVPKETGGNSEYNREHTWPNSYGFPDDNSSNYAYTDLHMLMVANIGYNGSRGSLPYGNCTASCTEYPTDYNDGMGGGTGSYPGNSNWSDGSLWEVWMGKRGDVARALLYMDVRFDGGSNPYTSYAEPDLVLTDNLSQIVSSGGMNTTGTAYMGRLSVLLQWAAEDPVSDYERQRNDVVELYQGNRNPFVDHPEWVACIFQNQCP